LSLSTRARPHSPLKIRLIEPAPAHLHVWCYTFYPRLGLPMIGAALKAAGHDVVIYCPQLEPVDWSDVQEADLVGISSTTSTAPAAYEIADRLRRRGVPTIMGGSHVTFMADEALEHADYVARGEGGDTLMLELIDALEGRRELDTIPGLSFMRHDVAVHNELRDRCADLDELPVPDLSLIAGCKEMRATPIMTSWGCPFACNFCSVTAMFGRKYRYRSPESVIAEIEEKQPKSIFFYDDNFAADKERLKTLLRMMIASGRLVPWWAQVRTDVAEDAELLDLMRRSKCDRLAIGLESVNQETLDSYDKSQSLEDIVRAIDTLHDYGIKSHGMFVLGADTDTRETIRDTVKFARKHHIDSLMLNILTPAPGTRQFAEMNEAGRIFDRHWDLFDGQHVVFTPAHMTPAELQREVLRAYARFYSPRQWLKHLAAFRYGTMALYIWYWLFLRKWRVETGNRAYLEMLKHLPLPTAPACAARSRS
jgi:anaerobic magnesium-protoporphyrin IX monomethyl ester cyclase